MKIEWSMKLDLKLLMKSRKNRSDKKKKRND